MTEQEAKALASELAHHPLWYPSEVYALPLPSGAVVWPWAVRLTLRENPHVLLDVTRHEGAYWLAEKLQRSAHLLRDLGDSASAWQSYGNHHDYRSPLDNA